MELLIGLVIIVMLLVALDIAALKWGKRSNSPEEWANGNYDPRYNWNSTDLPEATQPEKVFAGEIRPFHKQSETLIPPVHAYIELNLN